MAVSSNVDNTFTYHNKFENTIFTSSSPTANMADSRDLHNDPALQSFTATGRPITKTSASMKGTGLDGLNSADAFGAGAPNLLPFRFTDESIISVPVLPPPDISESKLAASDSDEDDNPIKGLKPKSRFSFSSFRRKSSSKKDKKPDFVMKDMTRAEYLKHYAKDDNGKYIGTEEPASDCILNTKEDTMKRRKAFAFREAMINDQQPIMFMGA
ncbi:hypothetical protein PMZ80_000772 [Knufia obscura]|uniref:Uncharacterized protein n=2 Tax=Knufia TaxID=430999 RepID=A0AAN8E9J6_9EURO|nr:hypothetical protein PMZ80_000772 [Knufia obscura]KAK5949143.1 hypothetical protein OHC33_009884 [Knufia fluminis]